MIGAHNEAEYFGFYITLDVGGGRRLKMDRRGLEMYGSEIVLDCLSAEQRVDFLERIPVYQGGRQIGTLSAGYHPLIYRSRSFFYDPRPDDFRRSKRGWEASPTLGWGDLDAIPDFRWGNDCEEAKRARREAEMNAILLGAICTPSPDGSPKGGDVQQAPSPDDSGNKPQNQKPSGNKE
jgi:hypothetical protein